MFSAFILGMKAEDQRKQGKFVDQMSVHFHSLTAKARFYDWSCDHRFFLATVCCPPQLLLVARMLYFSRDAMTRSSSKRLNSSTVRLPKSWQKNHEIIKYATSWYYGYESCYHDENDKKVMLELLQQELSAFGLMQKWYFPEQIFFSSSAMMTCDYTSLVCDPFNIDGVTGVNNQQKMIGNRT